MAIRISLIAVLLFSAVQCVGVPPRHGGDKMANPAFEKGREDAKKDLEAGKLVYYTVGAPAPWDQLWAEMLRKEYGISLRSGGCIPDSEAFQRANGYNTVSVPAIEAKYGEILGQPLTGCCPNAFTLPYHRFYILSVRLPEKSASYMI